jgi:hypothetical protein
MHLHVQAYKWLGNDVSPLKRSPGSADVTSAARMGVRG